MSKKDEDISEKFRVFLEESIKLGRDISKDSKESEQFLLALERSTNFAAVVEQRAKNKEKFFQEAKAFSNALKKWIEIYPKNIRLFKAIITLLIIDLQEANFVIVTTYPTFKITYNKKEFLHSFDITPGARASKFELINPSVSANSKEKALVREIAEIVSLEHHIQKLLVLIEQEATKKEIVKKADIILSKKTDKQIDFLSELTDLIHWWDYLKTTLEEIRKVTLTAIKLDKDAAKKLKLVVRQTRPFGLDQKQLSVAISALKLLAKISLDLIPGSNVITSAVDVYERRGLYHEALDAFRKKKR